MKLILASASTSRARLLKAAGVPFRVIPANIDENALRKRLSGDEAPKVAQSLAEAKAVHVSNLHPTDLVLGADQLVEFEGRIVSKSRDMDEAHDLLTRLQGRVHKLHSALALALGGVVNWRHCGTDRLTMRECSAEFLSSYLAEAGSEILSSVGCYQLEGLGTQLFERIDGDYFSVLGLPLIPLLDALRRKGVIAT